MDIRSAISQANQEISSEGEDLFYKPIFDEDDVMLTDLILTDENGIQYELHTSDKDKTFDSFSGFFKNVMKASEGDENMDSLAVYANRLLAELALDGMLEADYISSKSRKFIGKMFESLMLADDRPSVISELKENYLELISLRDKKNYFTLEHAEGEYAFEVKNSTVDNVINRHLEKYGLLQSLSWPVYTAPGKALLDKLESSQSNARVESIEKSFQLNR